jgi:hypothetical protein
MPRWGLCSLYPQNYTKNLKFVVFECKNIRIMLICRKLQRFSLTRRREKD